MIKENYLEVKNRIEEARVKGHNSRDKVTLIAVSKTKPLELLKEAYEAGARDFGENRVQELCDKIPEMPGDVRWHMIGHLQTNKVKYIVGRVYMIHSVDSLRLAQEISRESVKKNVVTNILIEVNIAGESTKFGGTYNDTIDLISQISKLPNIVIKGLMTVAPYTDNEEQNRPYFAEMYQLSVDIMSKKFDNVFMDELSMGMTGDYRVAVEEGASLVRVGTGIFGERDYNI